MRWWQSRGNSLGRAGRIGEQPLTKGEDRPGADGRSAVRLKRAARQLGNRESWHFLTFYSCRSGASSDLVLVNFLPSTSPVMLQDEQQWHTRRMQVRALFVATVAVGAGMNASAAAPGFLFVRSRHKSALTPAARCGSARLAEGWLESARTKL